MELEEEILNQSVELTRVKDNLDKHHLNSHELNDQMTKLENQVRKFY